ncbi:MAG: hypothetical protein AB7T31_03425 [Gemmatimonadales bacterium]
MVPPPAAEPGTPAEAARPEEPPAPAPEVARPLLLAGTRDDASATMVVVGELTDGGIATATPTSLASGATAGSEWILFADGVRVGRMTAVSVGPAENYCASSLELSGIVELVPSAAASERFLALPATLAGDVPHQARVVHEHDYDQRVASLTFAQDAIPRLGAAWPDGGVLPTRRDMEAFQPEGTDSPTFVASYVYRDAPTIGDPPPGAYALLVLTARQGGQFRETFEWFQAADSLGKGVPRYFGHLDWDRDGEGEILLDVFGAERRWHAVLEQSDGGWTRSFESACGIGTSTAR